MNPKDMTNEALLDAWLKEMKGDYEHGCPCESEVQRRLNERDVLRKENEELKAKLESATEAYVDVDLEKVERHFVTMDGEPVCLSSDVAELELQFHNAKKRIAELESIIEAIDSGDNEYNLKNET